MARQKGAYGGRFLCIPRVYQSCVYAVEMANGVVKVGYSENPRTRMSCLVHQCRSEFASDIARFHIGPDLGRRYARHVERQLLVLVRRVARPLPGYAEFFSGITFNEAVSLVEQVSVTEQAA